MIGEALETEVRDRSRVDHEGPVGMESYCVLAEPELPPISMSVPCKNRAWGGAVKLERTIPTTVEALRIYVVIEAPVAACRTVVSRPNFYSSR